ncbi:MAG: hypothetical protein E7643_02830 [Ruminococcaceae bacterium]|nr:hypothetical protein [Oscillospiraceae bacterium]
MELPSAFEARMKQLLPCAEYDAFLRALTQERAVKGLRVNTKKIRPEVFESISPFALEKIPYVDGGYIVSDDAGAGKHPYHHAGAYYMQDPGAMATVAAIPRTLWTRRGLRILDLCAAPGGKTTQLAAACAATGGAVLANEYVSSRARILAGNVERMGLSNVCVTNADSKYIAEWYPDFFDLTVVDAPCSGEGMFRKTEQAALEWSPENVRMCAARQREILENGARTVSPGGYLLYSTCTYSTEENEEVVLEFLRSHPDFSLVPCDPSVSFVTADGIEIGGGDDYALSLCRRFYPHRAAGEGQFAALLLRDGKAIDRKKPCVDAWRAPERGDAAVAAAFMKETLGRSMDGLCLCGGVLSLFPAHGDLHFPIPPFGTVAVGCALGEVRKGRILPHHHFFSCFGAELLSRVCRNVDDGDVIRYLCGEEIDADGARGMTAFLLAAGDTEIPLGGAKAADGRLKNYYPKGLRIQR